MSNLPISLPLLANLERQEILERERTEKYIFSVREEIDEVKKEFEKMNKTYHDFHIYNWPDISSAKKAKLSSPKWANFQKTKKFKGWRRNKR